MTTHQIDVDVTFASPEAATLAFGILHHATAAVAAGCRKQLVAGMASEDDAGEFLSKLLREPQSCDAILALTGRLMRELVAELATGLAVESSPTVDRTPAQVVRDGIRDKMHAAPPLDVIEAWTDAERDEVAGWLLDNRERDGFNASTMPDVLRVALYPNAALGMLNLEAVWTDGTLAYRDRTAAVSDGPTVGEEVMGMSVAGHGVRVTMPDGRVIDGPAVAYEAIPIGEPTTWPDGVVSQRMTISAPPDMARFEARSGHYLRATIDGEERRCREITVHELVNEPIVSIYNFTELCVRGNDPDTIEFYADGEDGPVDCVTLRIEPDELDDEGPDFSLETNGHHDGLLTLAEVARAFPTCAPTLAAWQAGHTLPFRAVLKRARELAGLTKSLPEESEPSPVDEEEQAIT